MILTQDYLSKFKIIDKKSLLFCLVYNFLKENRCMFSFHIKIAYDRRVCQEFDPGSVVQFQGHC